MITTQTVKTKWNSKTKSYYENLGYVFTHMGDVLEVSIKHLKSSSAERVNLICDYCGNKYSLLYRDVKEGKDACSKCKHLKAKDSVKEKYGVENVMHVQEFKAKRDMTIISLYGVENVFESNVIKDKIKETTLRKYGMHFTKTEAYNKKRKTTSLLKYGADSHMKLEKYKQMVSGKNSPVWKGGVHDERWERLQPEYKFWRDSIYSRDGYTCQKCRSNNKKLQAHHISNWKSHIDKRYDLDNGITLCESCHIDFHRNYGKKNNDIYQLKEYLAK